MFYDSHVTRCSERQQLLSGLAAEIELMPPTDLIALNPPPGEITLTQNRGRSAVWDEDHKDYYEEYFGYALTTLRQYENNKHIRLEETEYWRICVNRKGKNYCATRIPQLFELYESIEQRGWLEGSYPAVEYTGERLDGSNRAVIACYLGLPRIPVRKYRWTRTSVTEDLLRRKLAGQAIQFDDYYYIDFGGGFTRGPQRGVFVENSEKWDVLARIVGEPAGQTIVDLGCNGGYHSLQLAMGGALQVIGIDNCYIPQARLNQLIYEYVRGEDLHCNFISDDIRTAELPLANTYLMLNVLYHLEPEYQKSLPRKLLECCHTLVLQGNLRKLGEYDNVSIEQMTRTLKEAGWPKVESYEWGPKPFVVGYK